MCVAKAVGSVCALCVVKAELAVGSVCALCVDKAEFAVCMYPG